MPYDPVIRFEISGAAFSFYSSDEIRRLSVKKLTRPHSFDTLGNAVVGGVHDPALGPTDKLGNCRTCGLIYRQCPGHFGHIDLAEPVFSPLLFRHLITLLRCTCWYCGHVRLPGYIMEAASAALRLIRAGDVRRSMAALEILEQVRSRAKKLDDEESKSGDSREELWQKLALSLGELPESAPASPESGSAFAGVVGTEDQLVHLQTMRKALIRGLNKDMSTGSSKCPLCGSCKVKTRPDDSKTKILLDNFFPDDETAAKSGRSRKGVKAAASSSTATAELDKKGGLQGSTYVTPSKVREHLRKVWTLDSVQHEFLSLMYGSRTVRGLAPVGPEMFFIEVVPVPPNRFRPVVELGGMRTEHSQTAVYKRIIQCNNELIELNRAEAEGKKPEDAEEGDEEAGEGGPKKAKRSQKKKLSRIELLLEIQKSMNDLCVGGDLNKPPSIKEVLERKEGLFRKHMMGKRVNFAARSVISPDPFINTNEIGLPLYFAMRLSYPEPVTPRNLERLKRFVMNGPETYPGANFIEDEFGNRIELSHKKSSRASEASRMLTIAANAPRKFKIVFRHLQDGDVVLVNRQPTLHKPGIMAHAVKVLGKERTLRMHYVNCSTYNADFDGDEMNIHVPQGELPRAEAQLVAFTDEQYVVPKDGSPLRGLIQDSVITGVLLTKRDTFFNRSDFQQLLFACLFNVNTSHSIVTPLPAILKPRCLWTGKQLVSGVLGHVTVTHPPMNLEGTTKVAGTMWGRGGYYGPSVTTKKSPDMTDVWPGSNDSAVVIHQNELLCGILDRSQFGASAFGLVHSCYELYGSTIAGKLLSVLGRLFVTYMQFFRGFTCGIDDLMLKAEAEKSRRLLLVAANEKAKDVTREVASHGTGDDEAVKEGMAEARRDPDKAAELDKKVKQAVNVLASKVIEKCLPDGTIKRFPMNCMQLMTGSGARGSSVNASQISCLLGQQELEGKRVPVMLSGRTLPSFQRYDPSARAGGFVMDRFLTGVRPQEFYFHCMAGREGLIDTAVKTSRSGYLQRSLIKSLESLSVHYDYTVRDEDGSVVEFAYGDDALDVTRTCYLSKFKFWAANFDALVTRYNMQSAAQKFSGKDIKQTTAYLDDCLAKPGETRPILSRFFPAELLGVMSEKFYSTLKDYVASDPDKFFSGPAPKIQSSKFHGLMCLKYQKSLVDPGESVGLLASQSIGEPSTQMTLNTFHLAGRGDMNVTLGMPRLRELLMFAKVDIATPTMTIGTLTKSQEDATKVAKALSRLTLLDIVEDVTLTESLRMATSGLRVRDYLVQIKLKPDAKKTLRECHVGTGSRFSSKLRAFEATLKQLVGKHLKIKAKDVSTSVGSEKSTEKIAKVAEEEAVEDGDGGEATGKKKGGDDDDDDEEEGEMDAETESLRKKKQDHASYEEPDEEEVELIKEMESKEGFGKAEEEEEEEEEEEGGEKEGEEPKKEAALTKKDGEGDEEEESTAKVAWNEGTVTLTIQLPADKKVMMMQLVEQGIENLVLAECPGIRRCFVSLKQGSKTEYVVQTEGVNFSVLAGMRDVVDLNSVYSNNVAAILKYYGVEAARRAIVGEVGGVFKVYGINVDPRHLGLIADYMTFGGGFRACNRTGIDSNTSPLLKMSFETTSDFLTRAALYREVDMMESPAACLVVGKPIGHGTGRCEVRQIIPEALEPEGQKPEQQMDTTAGGVKLEEDKKAVLSHKKKKPKPEPEPEPMIEEDPAR